MATRTRPPHNPHTIDAQIERGIAREQARAARFAHHAAKLVSGPGTAKAVQQALPVTIKNPNDPASPSQHGYIDGLLDKLAALDAITAGVARDWYVGTVQADGSLAGGVKATMNKDLAHRTIDRLKLRVEEAKGRGTPLPGVDVQVTAVDRFHDVPDGYYAVDTNAGHLGFYRVTTWKDSGRRKVQVQAGPNWHLMRGASSADGVLAKVRLDTPPIAGKRYADELDHCYRCNLALTNEESRAVGMGRTCRSK